MARKDENQVVYVDGDVPQLPLQLGQLLVDSSQVSPGSTNLQQCTSQNPVIYEPVNPATRVTTVGALSAVATIRGARALVTDANATTFASVVAGGGANVVPVYCDGTNWRIG